MRDKSNVGGSKVSVVDAEMDRARGMADFLLRKEGGIGDKLTWAAHQVELKWGAPASIILRLRHRDSSDMLLSNWVKLKAAYEAACLQVERQAQHQQDLARDAGINEANSRLYKMAVALGRSKDEAAE